MCQLYIKSFDTAKCGLNAPIFKLHATLRTSMIYEYKNLLVPKKKKKIHTVVVWSQCSVIAIRLVIAVASCISMWVEYLSMSFYLRHLWWFYQNVILGQFRFEVHICNLDFTKCSIFFFTFKTSFFYRINQQSTNR